MKTIAIVEIILLVLYTLFFTLRTNRFLKNVNRNYNGTKCKSDHKIIIAIPCLREQNCIEDTIKYFKKISLNIPIILITTQKEIKENTNNLVTTQDIIKENIITKYDNVYWVDYPYTTGYMADQLNYMIDNLEIILDKKIDFEDTYLALYNADSRPNPKTFLELNKMKLNKNEVIQQYSYCMKNFEELKGIMKGFSIYQSNFEIKTGLINSFYDSRILYTHVVGHGLIINLKTLKTLGNFNTTFWCEDIYLSLQLKFNSIKVIPLLCLENIETPDKLSKLIQQNAVWYKTTSQFIKMYKDIAKGKERLSKLKGLYGAINEMRCAINWLMFPIVLCMSGVVLLILNEMVTFSILFVCYLLYVAMNAYCTIKVINQLENKHYILNFNMFFYSVLATTFSNIGPIYSILSNKKEKYKTER